MAKLARILPALVLIGLFCKCVAGAQADEPKKTSPTKEQVAQWIRDLGDNDFTTRQMASKRLWEAGRAAELALHEALNSNDAEVVRRSKELFDKFKWGIYPDTPEKLVE